MISVLHVVQSPISDQDLVCNSMLFITKPNSSMSTIILMIIENYEFTFLIHDLEAIIINSKYQ
jgi:hypothetical protein